MEDKINVVKLLGLPETFAVVLLTFSFVLLLAPYFSGADFGLFKIPQFTEPARRKLKIIGPIAFLLLFILFAPVIPRAPKTQPNINNADRKETDPDNAVGNTKRNQSTPADIHSEVQQHLARARELYAQARYDDAVKECNKALDLEPENQDVLSLRTSINKTTEILNRNQ